MAGIKNIPQVLYKRVNRLYVKRSQDSIICQFFWFLHHQSYQKVLTPNICL